MVLSNQQLCFLFEFLFNNIDLFGTTLIKELVTNIHINTNKSTTCKIFKKIKKRPKKTRPENA